jgi:hypothetical protein
MGKESWYRGSVRTNGSKDGKLKNTSHFTRTKRVDEIVVQREQKVEGSQQKENKEREVL